MLNADRHPSNGPLALREPAPARAGAGADIADAFGVDRDGRASFQQFVDQHRHLMSDYIARRMRGTPELCAEDALQDALIRMWQQWRHWPEDPERREVYMRQALKVAAVDAIRARYGRNMTRPREYPVNFADLDRCVPAEPSSQAIVRELGLAIARESLERRPEHRDIERGVLVAAFAALTDFERRVLFMTARGDNGAQIARDLGVRHQLVRETLMRSRRLMRSLIEHADAGKVSPDEARRLWNLRDGNLSGRPKREAQRHLDHCTTCKRLAGVEDAVSSAGVRVFLPLPAAIALATKGLAASATSGATTGAGSAAPATGALAATGGGLLSGATAKTAVALGVLALGGSLAGTGKLYRDRDRPQPLSRPATAVAAKPAAARAPRRRASQPRKRAKPRRASQPAGSPAPRTTTKSAGATASRQTTTAAPALSTPAPASSATSPAARRASTPAGGEFVLGGP